MSRDVLLALLAKGSNGEQILQILDSIADGVSDSVGSDSAANPTLSEIQFWYLTNCQTGTGAPGPGPPTL